VKKGTFIDYRAAEPAVLVRLVLLAADEGTGEESVVGSFLKPIPMPSDLAPGMTLALDIFGERHIFHPTTSSGTRRVKSASSKLRGWRLKPPAASPL
jgi:hypothetical protein